jgi:aminomethyltransferase
MVPFGGWDMPLNYGDGTLAEHRSCRSGAVVFDVSHLGTVRVTGEGARDLLQRTLTADLDKIEPGRTQYTHLLDADDGSVVDDIIVWWVDDERFDVMPNASNTDRVVDALSGDGVSAVDVTDTRAILAVQGPEARQRLSQMWHPDAFAVARRRVAEYERGMGGTTVTVAGTGYTGEDGVEIAVPAEDAQRVWDELLAVGVLPAGLGARDTLRLETGLPLHGHELGPGITPLQAGLGWVVGWDKGDFRGRAALEAEREAGPARRLRGLVLDGKRPPRAEQTVVAEAGDALGVVTSGNYSPLLDRGIALAFLRPDIEPGARVAIDIRGRHEPAEVVTPPFVTGAH